MSRAGSVCRDDFQPGILIYMSRASSGRTRFCANDRLDLLARMILARRMCRMILITFLQRFGAQFIFFTYAAAWAALITSTSCFERGILKTKSSFLCQ